MVHRSTLLGGKCTQNGFHSCWNGKFRWSIPGGSLGARPAGQGLGTQRLSNGSWLFTVFNLHPDTVRRRLQQAARAAGLPGWRDITGHSGRVGMAQDLSAAGFALPELMTAGRCKSLRMPDRYTERQAAGGVRWPGTTRAVGGRGPASQPGERAPAR